MFLLYEVKILQGKAVDYAIVVIGIESNTDYGVGTSTSEQQFNGEGVILIIFFRYKKAAIIAAFY